MKNENLNTEKIFNLVTIVFITLKISIHLFAGHYELHRDEMLYFNMGSHPAWGYLTVPPVTGWLASVIKEVLGYSFFGIRLLPALAGAVSFYLTARIVKLMNGGMTALIIALTTSLLLPGSLLLFSIFTPNAFEYLLWTLAICLMLKLMITENERLWIWIGITLGFSFMTKYSVLFLIAGFFFAFLLSKQWKLLLSWWFLAGILAGALIILPNIIWQYYHNWPVQFHFEELKKTQLDNLNYSHFFTDFFSLTSVWILLIIAGFVFLLANKKQPHLQLTGFAVLLVYLLFIGTKGKAYYVSGTLPLLIAAGGCFAEKIIRPKMVIIAVTALLSIFSLISLPFVIPVFTFEKLEKYASNNFGRILSPFMRWEDGKVHPVSQIYADMTGWQEMADLAGKAFNQLTEEEKKRCTVFCERNYGYGGAIHFYGKKYNLPQPVTYHESYIFWAPDTIPWGPAIYIHYEPGGMKEIFGEVTEIGTVNDPYFREKGVKVFLCRNPKIDVPDIYKADIKKERERFTREN